MIPLLVKESSVQEGGVAAAVERVPSGWGGILHNSANIKVSVLIRLYWILNVIKNVYVCLKEKLNGSIYAVG